MQCNFAPSHNLRFLAPVLPVGHDATAALAALPRPMRKTLRLAKHVAPVVKASALPDAVDNFLQTELRHNADTDAFMLNSYSTGDHADAFNDEDDEFAGLTMVEAMTEAELFAFCTGYDVL